MLNIFINTGLQPGAAVCECQNRFNGFNNRRKPLKRLTSAVSFSHPAEAGC